MSWHDHPCEVALRRGSREGRSGVPNQIPPELSGEPRVWYLKGVMLGRIWLRAAMAERDYYRWRKEGPPSRGEFYAHRCTTPNDSK